MTLLEYVETLRRHWRLIVALTVLGAFAGYGYAWLQPSVYRASATVLVSADTASSASDLVQGSTYVENLVTSYAVMATSEVVLAPVIDDLGLDATARSMQRSVTAESPLNTLLIDITADRSDPGEARDVADAVANQLAEAVSEVSPTVEGRPAVRISTIQGADLPNAPVSPDKRLLTLAGLLAGLVIGVLTAVLLRAGGGRVSSASDAAISAAPVLGEVLVPGRASTLPSVVLRNRRSPHAESLRRIAANLQYLAVDGGLRSVLVTSSGPAEGKTAIASGLALILAETHGRVLLLDADLRSPTVHELAGLDNSLGLSTVLIGNTDLGTAVQQWGEHGLQVLTGGPVPPNPGQLLASDSLGRLLESARGHYDMVVVDTGPLALVSDALALGHRVDGRLVVARQGKTRVRVLRRTLESLDAAHVPASGVVVTRVQRRRRTKHTYGYSTGRTRSGRWRLRRSRSR